jgi:hypothetical protein
VYLETWGSGMSALNSYLMIPFIALFGMHTWVIRLPQFICSCLTLPVVYRLVSKMINKNAGLMALLYLAVSPWSIMSARWGIDCNLAPAFLLFGFYFFVMGADNAKYFLLSAFFYGAGLYSYITIWPIMPVLLVLMTIYLLYTKRLKVSPYLVGAVCILTVFALPLILFLLVNNGYINEITTRFISIPKLSAMRGSEISFSDKLWKLKNNIIMLLRQYDGLYWNATEKFGLYYKGFMIFGVIGGIYCLKNFVISIIRRSYNAASMLLFPFACGVMLCALITANFNRINCLHIPISIFIGIGLYIVGEFIRKYISKLIKPAHYAVYVLPLVCFICFEIYYFTEFRQNIAAEFQEGLGDAVEYAMQLTDGTIYVEEGFIYSKILYYSKLPAAEYISTVTHREARVSSFGRFIVEPEEFPDSGVCIILPESEEEFLEKGFNVEKFEYAAVAYR